MATHYYYLPLRICEGKNGKGDYNIQNRNFTNKVKVQIANRLNY